MAAFIKFDGIEGEARDDAHKGWIEIESYSLGVSQPATVFSLGSRRSSERASISDVSFVKVMDKSSPKLYVACCSGERFAKVELHFATLGRELEPYLKYELTDCLISGYSTSGGGGDDVPTESLSLNFAQFKVTYTPQKADGSADPPVEAGWDLVANTKL